MSAALNVNARGKVVAGSFLTAIRVPRAFGLSDGRRATRYSVPLGLCEDIAGGITISPGMVPPGAAAGAGAAGAPDGAGAGAGAAACVAGSSGGTPEGLPASS